MKIQNVKGGYDFLPKEQQIRNYINKIIIDEFEKCGFNNIETPILCYYDMLADKYDSNNDILKEIYKLTDQGDRKLGLRYDLTVPFAKFVALNKNNIQYPFKRYEISKVFRDGPVKVGRDREFTQCDADVVGLEGEFIEAELIDIFAKVFKRLDIDIKIKYNNRKLMNGLILESGIDENLLEEVTTIIDKIEKVSIDEFKKMLTDIKVSNDSIDYLINTFKLSFDELKNKFKDTNNELIKKGIEELSNLEDYITSIGLKNVCYVSLSLARGQNYYTGNVFEVYEQNLKVRGSIGGGGRYDNLVTNFINDGEKYPCVGISFGLTSLYELLKDRFNDTNSLIDYYVIPMNTNKESLILADTLRSRGYKVLVEMKRTKLKKCLDFANKEKIKYVIILGEDEINNKVFKIKNMFSGEEKEVKFDSLNNIEI